MSELRRSVKSDQRYPRQLYARVDGVNDEMDEGGLTSMSLTKNGAGDYTLTFDQQFARVPIVVATPIEAGGDAIITLGSVSASSVQILAWDGTDGTTPKDVEFHTIIHGFDADDEL